MAACGKLKDYHRMQYDAEAITSREERGDKGKGGKGEGWGGVVGRDLIQNFLFSC